MASFRKDDPVMERPETAIVLGSILVSSTPVLTLRKSRTMAAEAPLVE